uniref:Cyanophage baseplate Pam3 plug gp18 domain-containing protein n=1 Tax=Myoviridae sp. ctg8M33 TaxID=2826680 RepID=A0A8S5NML4_9CAUD|nr:MAG TPA: hypothetical protein [Myoviridae sp. ctg8M33]
MRRAGQHEGSALMDYTIIEVPDMNDSVSRVVLSGTAYLIRFTYNDSKDYWKFSLYDSQNVPIVLGVKIVPQFPLNVFLGLTRIPAGVFGAMSKLDRIGRDDFKSGNAQFIFCPVDFGE